MKSRIKLIISLRMLALSEEAQGLGVFVRTRG